MDLRNLSMYNEYNNGTNDTAIDQKTHYNYYAMLLTLLIFVIVFGNVLVCMAVSREKALQTTTNYLIVSLAVADLLVATLVMPWVVYLEIQYTAVAMPMLYNTRYSSKRRVTVMIAVVWVLSFAISCPLLFGLNNTASNECLIENPAFVIYSSVVSFYVPFIVTLLVYVQIYIVLRKRRKRVNTKRNSRGVDAEAHKDKCTHPEDVKLCAVFVKSNGSFPANKKKVEAESHPEEMEMEMMSSTSPPEKTKHKSASPNHQQLAVPATSNQFNTTVPSPADSPCKAEKNGHTDSARPTKAFETQTMPNGKTRTSLKTMSKRKISQQKEKKATQMLAIVLGEYYTFLIVRGWQYNGIIHFDTEHVHTFASSSFF
ncbi:hypothetical protein GDO81_014292 [Engystomops pustulosus]|uniref:G-protein coupled receptors family 1 profile domain-containing protein n=1 Tax=Engystomops pustulosus TaxID=76066 RepID=A0AAV7B9H9_ENGPU|nr:hypothetical protein GDO81_014292 [Engystomops pustulosus]